MRKLDVVCLILVMVFGFATVADAQIKWEKDFQASIAKAKADNKPILLDFFNPN
jgi:hypothetical protein